jgi:hypothetical protein
VNQRLLEWMLEEGRGRATLGSTLNTTHGFSGRVNLTHAEPKLKQPDEEQPASPISRLLMLTSCASRVSLCAQRTTWFKIVLEMRQSRPGLTQTLFSLFIQFWQGSNPSQKCQPLANDGSEDRLRRPSFCSICRSSLYKADFPFLWKPNRVSFPSIQFVVLALFEMATRLF